MRKIIIMLSTLGAVLFFTSSAYPLTYAKEGYIYGEDRCATKYSLGCLEVALGKEIGYPIQYGYLSTSYTTGNPYGLNYSQISHVNYLKLSADLLISFGLVCAVYGAFRYLPKLAPKARPK